MTFGEEVVQVFKSDEDVADLWSVAIKHRGGDGWDVYTMSDHPGHPQGVNQYAGAFLTKEIKSFGKKMSLRETPRDVVVAIVERMSLYI